MRNKAVLILTLLELVFLDVSLSSPDEGKDTLLEKLDILVRVQKLLQTGERYFNTIFSFSPKFLRKYGSQNLSISFKSFDLNEKIVSHFCSTSCVQDLLGSDRILGSASVCCVVFHILNCEDLNTN